LLDKQESQGSDVSVLQVSYIVILNGLLWVTEKHDIIPTLAFILMEVLKPGWGVEVEAIGQAAQDGHEDEVANARKAAEYVKVVVHYIRER
jgi:hypothetical protein